MTKTVQELEAESYVPIGKLSVKINRKRCYNDTNCKKLHEEDDITERFLENAQQIGADGVVLHHQNHLGEDFKTEEGKCMVFNEYCEEEEPEQKQENEPYDYSKHDHCNDSNLAASFACLIVSSMVESMVDSTVDMLVDGVESRLRCKRTCAQYETVQVHTYYEETSGYLWRKDTVLARKLQSGEVRMNSLYDYEISTFVPEKPVEAVDPSYIDPFTSNNRSLLPEKPIQRRSPAQTISEGKPLNKTPEEPVDSWDPSNINPF